jgi:hypothetical protein
MDYRFGRLLSHGALQTGRWDERDRFERSMAQVDLWRPMVRDPFSEVKKIMETRFSS